MTFCHLSSQKCFQKAAETMIVKLVSTFLKRVMEMNFNNFSNKCSLARESRFITIREMHILIEQSGHSPPALEY